MVPFASITHNCAYAHLSSTSAHCVSTCFAIPVTVHGAWQAGVACSLVTPITLAPIKRLLAATITYNAVFFKFFTMFAVWTIHV